jgi:hypothetical protein
MGRAGAQLHTQTNAALARNRRVSLAKPERTLSALNGMRADFEISDFSA